MFVCQNMNSPVFNNASCVAGDVVVRMKNWGEGEKDRLPENFQKQICLSFKTNWKFQKTYPFSIGAVEFCFSIWKRIK